MCSTAATLFSGGGGADIGLSEAGLDVKWGLEHDEEIALVARNNGLDIHTADVTEVDPSWYERVDVLHASPPCPNFSVAKTGAEETDEDVSLAEATTEFIREIEPQLFTLENVWGYRKSRSWKLIREHLQRSGYDWNAWRLNAANYGVPQTRKRMIVAGRKGGRRPKKPPKTHAEDLQQGGLFGSKLSEWVGWHEAVEDLIPGLPETELADWQKERLPDDLLDTELVHGTSTMERRNASAPSASVVATVVRKAAAPRAVLVNTNWSGEDRSTVCRREDQEPAFSGTVSDGGRLRAVLINESSTLEARQQQPAASQVATQRNTRQRAVMGRRVVQMTPRCLARFQTFPDWYELPSSKSLACRIIGNALPPLAMKKWVSQWTSQKTT